MAVTNAEQVSMVGMWKGLCALMRHFHHLLWVHLDVDS
jgi:hypothetical protein